MTDSEKKYQEELIALKNEFEEFVYIVSHDIKTPMRAISNIATWIEDDLGSNADKDVLENFKLLKNRVGRLEKMMNALLELSRVNRSEMELYEVNIPKLVSDCIETIENKSEVEFHLSYNLINENAVILGMKLQKVLFNLLDNAVRFHDKEKKNVFVEVTEEQNQYVIQVRDDGPGIPEDVKNKIFAIFYTVHSKDIVDTTGAGLAISNKIIKMVGGVLTYTPATDNGSLFKFNWPK